MIHFGTGGWRAVIADEFTKANIRLLIAGLCSLMHKEGHDGAEICVGYDRRFYPRNLPTGRRRSWRAMASGPMSSIVPRQRRS